MPTTANTINYYVAADGTLRDGPQGSIPQQPRINYGTDYVVTLSFPPYTIAEGDQLQVALNRTRTFFSSASATGDAPVAAVVKHDVTAEEAAAQEVTLILSTNTRAMIDQVNGIDHPVRGFFGVHILRGQSFVTLAVADALMMSLESGPDAISPSLPVVDYPTRQEAEALTERAESAAERAEEAAAGIVPPLQLSAPPTTSTVGSVGQLAVWHDSTTNKDHLYHLCFVSEGESATLYHWEECVLVSMGNVAGGYAALNENRLVSPNNLPIASYNSRGTVSYQAARIYGIGVFPNGNMYTEKAANNNINEKEQSYKPIVPSNLDYAVRSVLPNVTEIPAATSDYSLVDSSATTNNHSHVYSHVPATAPTYRLPQVTNTTIAHYIELTVDFTAVQTYSFLDYQGEPIVPLFTPSIAAGDVYTFKMEYSAIKAAWLIYPQKQGAVADDFVMRGEVGAANGVAGLDANAKVPSAQLPLASASVLGGVTLLSIYGLTTANDGNAAISYAPDSDISSRTGTRRPITPAHLNHAVTAAITDSNHITLTDAQKATAQSVFGVGGPITAIPAATSAYTLAEGIFTHAPTSAPTYTLPNITDDIRTHEVVLIIDFSSVQTFSFLVDGGGDVTFQSYANPTMGDVWVFRCWWYGGKWRIAPTKIKNCVTRQLANGSLAIADAVAGDALALKMVAARSVVVNQLVQNGDFSDGTNNWAASYGTIVTSGGSLVFTLTEVSTGSGLANIHQTINLVPNHVYAINIKNIVSTADTKVMLRYNNISSTVRTKDITANTNTTFFAKFNFSDGTSGNLNIYVNINRTLTANVDTVTLGTIQLVDLTQYFNGNTTLIDSITSWDDLVAYDPRFASYVEYNTGEVAGVTPSVSVNNGAAITSPASLFAVGSAADKFEAVSGVTTRRMGSYTFTGNETFYTYEDTFWCYIADRKKNQNVLMAGFTIVKTAPEVVGHPTCLYPYPTNTQIYFGNQGCVTIRAFKTWITGKTIYYELAEPTTSQSTPTQISLKAGSNVAMQTDGGRLAPIDITYESDEL